MAELQLWWLRRMLAVTHPIHERLTWTWHDHFATSIEKVGHAAAMCAQNEKLRTLGRGDFRKLAQAMLTDPAMIYWLDGQANTKESPNENLARETMELFCLGHGNGYSEKDVKAAAASLTGLTLYPHVGGRLPASPARLREEVVLRSDRSPGWLDSFSMRFSHDRSLRGSSSASSGDTSRPTANLRNPCWIVLLLLTARTATFAPPIQALLFDPVASTQNRRGSSHPSSG